MGFCALRRILKSQARMKTASYYFMQIIATTALTWTLLLKTTR